MRHKMAGVENAGAENAAQYQRRPISSAIHVEFSEFESMKQHSFICAIGPAFVAFAAPETLQYTDRILFRRRHPYLY